MARVFFTEENAYISYGSFKWYYRICAVGMRTVFFNEASKPRQNYKQTSCNIKILLLEQPQPARQQSHRTSSHRPQQFRRNPQGCPRHTDVMHSQLDNIMKKLSLKKPSGGPQSSLQPRPNSGARLQQLGRAADKERRHI